MARRRPPATEPPRLDGLTVPPELAVGGLIEVWGEERAEFGAFISAWGRYSRARTSWEQAHGLDTRTACRLLPRVRPWSATDPGADVRLARLGLTRSDLPRLRRAAGERNTEPTRRTP
jgi:hypothetical protein